MPFGPGFLGNAVEEAGEIQASGTIEGPLAQEKEPGAGEGENRKCKPPPGRENYDWKPKDEGEAHPKSGFLGPADRPGIRPEDFGRADRRRADDEPAPAGIMGAVPA